MKRDRHGKAKILNHEEIQLLFTDGLKTTRDRTIFATALFTAARINEVVTLLTADIYDTRGQVRSHLTIRKSNTKGKLATRSIPIIENLQSLLIDYYPQSGEMYLFPGRHGRGHIISDSAARILRKACANVGIEGVSTHSFRRTALTSMSDHQIPLRVIAEVSGHCNLSGLHTYLEVHLLQVLGAVSSLAILSPKSNVGLMIYPDLPLSNAGASNI
ncbi:tyrosine-type recombinase/integrase [Komarekiella sp. 'clone 1']|uniref:Tyrosine-type recombinase/integrase n=1 Tax=Komarekiella delphini-convector SJRDD-AB1 TaxID=2593771 RepID=A0AA40VVN6_9NOST|nr:tyrosine-type recombinase/integrase [Komarekiella delphini-convector]MBD6621134.1 tyrosine-type recombinase/integrase [Komarekiella delphini-convector SJRDD-AB1]